MTNYNNQNMSKGQKIKQKIKSHIPKDWLTELRITYRIVIETLKGINRTGLVNLYIIMILGAILTIFGAIFRTSLSISSIVDEMGNYLEISAYLNNNANKDEVIKEIKGIDKVVQVKFLSKQKAWENLKNEIDVSDMQNPLPDTLHIKVTSPEAIDSVMAELKHIKGINDTNYAKDLVKKFETINKISHTVTFIVIIVVSLLTIMIINNTIALVIQSRKEEIEIMQLVGISNWYIKTPLVLQGAIYGFFGAILAIVPVNITQNYLQKMHSFFMIPAYQFSQSLTILTILILGVVFAASGSLLSIKKHLQQG